MKDSTLLRREVANMRDLLWVCGMGPPLSDFFMREEHRFGENLAISQPRINTVSGGRTNHLLQNFFCWIGYIFLPILCRPAFIFFEGYVTFWGFSLVNFGLFSDALGPWTYTCSKENDCIKLSDSSPDPNGISLTECKLTCGEFAQLWPRPKEGKCQLSKVVSFFIYSNFFLHVHSL